MSARPDIAAGCLGLLAAQGFARRRPEVGALLAAAIAADAIAALGAGLLVAGLAAVVFSSAVLAASPIVLAAVEGEHEVRGGREVGDVRG